MIPHAPDRIGQVRQLVRGLLERAPSYAQLPERERGSISTSLVKILGYLADAGAGAAPPAGEGFEDLVKAVDFPAFVSDLIKGVFDAIVTSSIQQMQAYQQLLEEVAGSVDAFVQDESPDQTAREHPAAKRALAQQRQQQLATMVLMGINRIVVTDGKL